MRYAILLAAILLSTPADAQWRMMHSGAYGVGPFHWGSGRYWGWYGRPGGYYNPGDYRWNGVQFWRYRNYY